MKRREMMNDSLAVDRLLLKCRVNWPGMKMSEVETAFLVERHLRR